MKLAQEITLAYLQERIKGLAGNVSMVKNGKQLIPDIILAHEIQSVLRAMFAHNPQAMAHAMYADDVCPKCVAVLTNTSQQESLTREGAIAILEEVVNGDLIESNLKARLAKSFLGSEADEILTSLRRQRGESVYRRDFMSKRHRVPGSAFSRKK